MDINLFPNPTCNGITVKINESNDKSYVINIIDLNGNILVNDNAVKSNYKIKPGDQISIVFGIV